MLRIVVDENAGGTAMLHLEGQVIGPWVNELHRVCEPLIARGAPIDLDLSAVSFVSREGVELLGRLGDGPVRLINCSPLVTEQLKARTRDEGVGDGSPGTGLGRPSGDEGRR